MLKKIISHIGLGLAIGFICTTASLWIFGAYNGSGMSVMRQFTVWLAASALYGIISLIYDTELALPKAVIIHFFSCLAVTLAAAVAAGLLNFMSFPTLLAYVIPSFIIIYLIIGASVAAVEHINEKQINEKISQNNNK